MTEHLPECRWPKYAKDRLWGSVSRHAPRVPCICDELRTCEERVTTAAVQRVEALPDLLDAGFTYSDLLHRASAIAAIKGDSND